MGLIEKRTCFLLLLFFCTALSTANSTELSSATNADNKVKTAKELLESYAGEQDILAKAGKILDSLRVTNENDPIVNLLLSRYTLYNGYLGDRYVTVLLGPEKTRVMRLPEFKTNSLEDARAFADKAIQSDNNYADAYAWRAHFEILEGEQGMISGHAPLDNIQLRVASELLASAIKLHSQNLWLSLSMAEYLDNIGQRDAAVKKYRSILKSGTKDKSLLLLAKTHLIYSGWTRGTLTNRLFLDELKNAPHDPWIKASYAEFLRDVAGDYDEAVKYAKEVVKITNSEKSKNIVARCLYMEWADRIVNHFGKNTRAETDFNEAQVIDPDLGTLMAGTGEYPFNIPFLIKALRTKGISINAPDKSGATNLAYAAFYGFTNTVQFLLQSGADPNIRLPNHQTPLTYAVEEGHYSITKMLLERGADPTQTVNGIDDALSLAQTQKNAKMIDLIQSYVDKIERSSDIPEQHL